MIVILKFQTLPVLMFNVKHVNNQILQDCAFNIYIKAQMLRNTKSRKVKCTSLREIKFCASFFPLCPEEAASGHTTGQTRALHRNKAQIHEGVDDLAINVYIQVDLLQRKKNNDFAFHTVIL